MSNGPSRHVIPGATRSDLEALPPTWRGEILDGILYAFPRPRAEHANLEGALVDELRGPFQRGRGGPGGWWILVEPGIEIPRSPEFSPDLAGWRRERMPSLPGPKDPIRVVPDWVCEILSPSTAGYDNLTKRRFYLEIGVRHIWYVDLRTRQLEVCRAENGRWVGLGFFGADAKVRIEPFDAIEIDLAEWWPEGALEEEEG